MRINSCTAMCSAEHPDGVNRILSMAVSDLLGLIEATSKEGEDTPAVCGDCAWTCGACSRPNTIGPAIATAPMTANTSFLPKLSFSARFRSEEHTSELQSRPH